MWIFGVLLTFGAGVLQYLENNKSSERIENSITSLMQPLAPFKVILRVNINTENITPEYQNILTQYLNVFNQFSNTNGFREYESSVLREKRSMPGFFILTYDNGAVVKIKNIKLNYNPNKGQFDFENNERKISIMQDAFLSAFIPDIYLGFSKSIKKQIASFSDLDQIHGLYGIRASKEKFIEMQYFYDNSTKELWFEMTIENPDAIQTNNSIFSLKDVHNGFIALGFESKPPMKINKINCILQNGHQYLHAFQIPINTEHVIQDQFEHVDFYITKFKDLAN